MTKGGIMFKLETATEVAKVLTDFFREEQGNRVTSNNMQSLLVKVQQVFDNKTIPEEEKIQEKGKG